MRALLLLSAGLVASSAFPLSAQQSEMTVRELHNRVVHNLVRIRTPRGMGSGWLLSQSGRPLVVTNKHVISDGAAEVVFYRGTSTEPTVVRARVLQTSRNIDLTVLRLDADPPASAQPHEMRASTTVYRGERIVLGGNPAVQIGNRMQPLPFQTTYGVVTGHIASPAFVECGRGRNCIVVDAASLRGSSGGPAFNLRGELVGMLWGGPDERLTVHGQAIDQARIQNPSFAYLIHARTIAEELQRMTRQ